MGVALRLPGIAVDAVPPVRGLVLPPMDIAGFAGFAAKGPCHRAVAIDSVATFEAVFGGEAVLARDSDGASDLRAQLPGAVRGFFANGGRKCWVVRLARTAESEAQWSIATGSPVDEEAIAQSNTFPVPGILHRLPGLNGDRAHVRPAWMQAASPGSWSDDLRLSARAQFTPLPITACHPRHRGLRFADPGGLQPGALVEFASANGMVRRYARVIAMAGGEWHAVWSGTFARVAQGEADDTGHAQITLSPDQHDAQLINGEIAQIRFTAPPPTIAQGSWIRFFRQGEAVWLRCDAYAEGVASGPAWQQVRSHMPDAPFAARRVRIDWRADIAGARQDITAREPGLAGPSGLAAMPGDDAWYAGADRRRGMDRGHLVLRDSDLAHLPDDTDGAWAAAAARFMTGACDRATRDLLRASWLPLGLDTAYASSSTARPVARMGLQRDGLARVDDTLFLDPAFATLSADRFAEALALHRDLGEGHVLGLHALLDTPDTAFGLPTILAAPDMAQPGWQAQSAPGTPGRADAASTMPATWTTHRGGCPPMVTAPIAAPDFSRFLDAATRLLPTPALSGPDAPDRDGNFRLSWNDLPDGVEAVLEESGAADFTGASEIYRGGAQHIDLANRGEGAWYYRLRLNDGHNISLWATHSVLVRRSDFVALPVDLARLRRLQIAAMRAAAGSQDMFALLSLPAGLDQRDALAHAAALTTLSPGFATPDRLGPQEARVLSYGALYHGQWLYRAASGTAQTTAQTGPEGCIAGQMAAIARQEGAWIAPAHRAVSDAVGIAPRLSPDQRLAFQAARVNALVPLADGFAAGDAMTLSPEVEWGQINVRRLMILLRLTALRRGEPLVFEPNGDVVRRALEREFAQMLGEFQRRGAFVGGAQGWRLTVGRDAGDLDGGRLVADIGVAPAQPLRFLTFRLVQQGARLTLAEAA